MSGKRQKNQLELAWKAEAKGEARSQAEPGTELSMAVSEQESPAAQEQLMEEVCQPENLRQAYQRVKANKGSAGVDGMTVRQLYGYLSKHWRTVRDQLLSGTYEPKPVKRVEIPKPDGGVRKLGIPTVLDRFVQQAVMQVLQRQWDPTFSEQSYGFRPGRSARQAVEAAQQYQREGYRWVVDMDLEKFFDRVNHDRLMGAISLRVADKRMLKLIRAFLNAGVMENGLVSPSVEGTPQGGPLSPLLSNLVLDELDRELKRRKLRFARYADDCNIYVRSERAGRRVMDSISRFITERLKLKVNQAKSAVARPRDRKFLGFSFTNEKQPRRRIAPKAVTRFKERVRELTKRTRGVSLQETVNKLATYLKGWRGYFGFCETPSVLQSLEGWVRRRLRCFVWKQWRRGRRRVRELTRLGVPLELAVCTAGSALGPWRLSNSKALNRALSPSYFTSIGLPSLLSGV